MSQVSRVADCPETLEEARALIDKADKELKRLRAENKQMFEAIKSATEQIKKLSKINS